MRNSPTRSFIPTTLVADILVAGLGCTVVRADPPLPPATVTASIECTSSTIPVGQFGVLQVDPLQPVPWHIVVAIEPDSTCVGLAGFVADVLFGGDYDFSLPPMTRGSLFSNFDRPAGLSNPAPSGSGNVSAYGGTPVLFFPNFGALLQVGGIQNTSGLTGSGFCEVAFPVTGVAIGGNAEVASGVAPSPVAVGFYSMILVKPEATVLLESNAAPDFSVTELATVEYGNQYLQMQVVCRADFNNSQSLDSNDIFDFLAAWFAGDPSADADRDGVLTVTDIFAFLNLWFAGCMFP